MVPNGTIPVRGDPPGPVIFRVDPTEWLDDLLLRICLFSRILQRASP